MSTTAQLKQHTLDALKAKMKAVKSDLENDAPVMKQVAVFLDSWVQRNFKSKGGGVGGWAPYKYGGRMVRKAKANAQSVEGRHYINTNAAMLQDTGALRISFLPFIRKGIAGVGSELPYSKDHNDGDEERGLPQRRILPENKDVEVDVLGIMDNFVKVTIRKAK